MGKIKHIGRIREFLGKTPVFSLSSLRRIVGENNPYLHILIHNLLKKREMFRITKGWYSSRDDPTLAVFCFKPAYLGLQEALSIHNLWEQETNVIIMTTKRVREGTRSVFNNNVFIKRIPPSLFFGIEYKQYGDFSVPVSDVEKTVLDMVFFNQPMDTNIIAAFRKKIDRKKIKEYLQRYDEQMRKNVLNLMKM